MQTIPRASSTAVQNDKLEKNEPNKPKQSHISGASVAVSQ